MADVTSWPSQQTRKRPILLSATGAKTFADSPAPGSIFTSMLGAETGAQNVTSPNIIDQFVGLLSPSPDNAQGIPTETQTFLDSLKSTAVDYFAQSELGQELKQEYIKQQVLPMADNPLIWLGIGLLIALLIFPWLRMKKL